VCPPSRQEVMLEVIASLLPFALAPASGSSTSQAVLMPAWPQSLPTLSCDA